MLLWESLTGEARRKKEAEKKQQAPNPVKRALRSPRNPYDKRCAALNKAGHRCKGRIREGSDYCTFHDPELSAEKKSSIAAKGGKSRRSLAHLPSGYLRNLTSRTAVGNAMDQLYREVRLGLLTPDMGRVLLDILTRILDSGLCQEDQVDDGRARRQSKADKIRPKLTEELTRQELISWRKAAENAPPDFVVGKPDPKLQKGAPAPKKPKKPKKKPVETVKDESKDAAPVHIKLSAAS